MLNQPVNQPCVREAAPKRVFKREGRLELNPLLIQAFGITPEELGNVIKSAEEPEAMRDMFAFMSDYATLSEPGTRLLISGDKLDFMVADMRRRMARIADFYEYHAKTSGDIEEEERLLKFARKAKQLSLPVGDTRTDKIAYIDAVMGFQHTSGLVLPLAFGITDYGREDYWPRKLLAFLRSHGMPGMVREGSAPNNSQPKINWNLNIREGRIVYMPPEEYMERVNIFNRIGMSRTIEDERKAIGKGYRGIGYYPPLSEQSYRSILEGIRVGNEMDIPNLVYRNGMVDNQEGFHRALVARDIGIEKIPVQVIGEMPSVFSRALNLRLNENLTEQVKAINALKGRNTMIRETTTSSSESVNIGYFIRENITPDIENVLRRLKIEGNTVKITEQLDRKLYEGVNEVLVRLGGKWDRSAQAHIFPSDPTERINAVLTAGKLDPKIKTGYFPTPPELARRMVEMLDLKPGDKVLEPSAGQGGLLDQLPKGTQVIIGEILPENIQILKQKGYTVNFDNFLGVEIGGVTKVIMNPPFENQQDIEHVTRALRMLQPGGTLVSVMAPGIKFRDNKKTTEFIEMLDRDYYHEIIDLPEGSFKESGTGVGAVLLKVTKPMSTPSTVSSEFVADTTKVNPELAARSHMGTSWDPEKRAEQEIAGFGQYVQEVYDNLKKAAHSERQTAFVESEIKTFQDRFAKYYNDLLARKGRTMSTFITGGSNFNVRRADKANDAERAKYEEMIEFRDRAVTAIMRELRKIGIEEQGGELEVLKKKLLNAQRSQEVMKEANAILRKNIPKEDKVKAIMEKTGMAEPSVLRLFEPDYAKRIGYPQFELTNNLANIHRMEQRVKEMEKKEATPSEDIPFEGGTISDNAEQDRVQINFDKKPEPAMIEKLKSEGWRWSPSNSAWQRKRTDMALRSARRIVGLPENWANPKFLEIKKDPTKEIYDRLRDKAGTEGVNKFEMAIARIIAISDNAPLRQQDTNRLKALVASLSNLSLGELKALDKTIKRWGENLNELKAPLDYVYSELLKKAQAEEPKPFVSTAPDTLVSIVERSTPSPTQQTITALKPENVSPAIKPNDDIILEPYDPIEGWNRYIRTRVGNTEHFVANSIELKNILGGLGSIYYYDSLYNKQNPITIKHTEYGYFKVLYFLENNYIDPKYIIKSESVAMLPEKQSPPQPLVSTAQDKLVSIVERSNITQPQTQAVIDLRWVYGTKDGKWYLVGAEDRDYVHGITQQRMKIIGPEAAKAEYLSPTLMRAAAPAQPAMMYVPPKHPPLLYPAPEAPRPAEEIMFVPNPETMTRGEYIKEKFRRLAQVLRQQGKPEIAARAEQATDPEWTSKFAASHRDQVVLALAQNKPVSPLVLKDYPDIVGNIRKVNEEILAKIKTDREQIKAAERAEENTLNTELNQLPPALKRHAETEIYSTLRLPETHKDYRNRFYIALGKVRRIAFTHLPQGKEPQPIPLPEKKESLIDALLNIQPGKDILIGYGDIPKGAEKITLPLGGSGTVIERRGNLVAIGIFAGAEVASVLYVQKDSQMIRIRPIPHQKIQAKTGEIVNTPEYDRWVERIRTEAPEYMPEWETTTAGIRAGDTIIHKTAKYTAVVDKVYKNGNADITVTEAKGIPEWEKSIKEGFPIKTTVKGANIDMYFEKVSPELSESLKKEKEKLGGTGMAEQYEEKPPTPEVRDWMKRALGIEDYKGGRHDRIQMLALLIQNSELGNIRSINDAGNMAIELGKDLEYGKPPNYGMSMERYYGEKIAAETGKEVPIIKSSAIIKPPAKAPAESGAIAGGTPARHILTVTEPEGYYFGTQIEVLQGANPELEPYFTGTIKRLLNNGELVEVHPEGDPREVSFRVPVDRVNVIRLVQQEMEPTKIKKLYRYYYLHRPPSIGTQPEGFINHESWLPAKTTPHGRTAFGWVEYDRPLTPEETSRYELFEDEVELPKLVKELVQFAHDEGIDEAMKAIDATYGRAVWDWLKSQKRLRTGVGQKEQVRDEIIRLAGITAAPPAAPPGIEKFNPEQAIKIAADSIDTLRRVDVFRVLNQYKENSIEIGNYIKSNRPDLVAEVDKILGELQPKDKFAEIQDQMQRDKEKIIAESLYKRYTSGYSAVSLLGIVRQESKDLAHSIGYELKLDTAIYTPAVLLPIAEKFKEFAQKDYDKEHQKYLDRKAKEQAEKEMERQQGGQAFWDEVKNLKVVDFEVQHDINPDKPSRDYYHVYDRTFAILENGKKVQVSYVIYKGEEGKRALKATKEFYMRIYGQYMGKPLSEWITYDQLMNSNRYEDYKAQQPKPRFTFIPEAPQAAPPAEQPSPNVQARFNAYISSTVLQTGALASPKFLSDERMAQDIERNIQVSLDEARSLVPQFRAIAEKRINKEEVESVKELFGIDVEQEAHKLGIDLADYAIIKAGNKVILQHKTMVQRQYEIKQPAGFTKKQEEETQERLREAQRRKALTIPAAAPPAAKPVQSIQEIKQQVLDSIQAARTVEELQPVLKGIGFLPLPEPEKRQVMDAYQNKYSILMSERPFGVPVKGEEKVKVIGAPTPQQLFEAELRRKAAEARRVPTLTGGAVTSRKLEMFEPGAMEKVKAEAETRKRIEQLGLPYEVHPVIRKLATGTQDVMKFGSKRGTETVDDIVLARYVRYCPPGTIIDNRSMPRVPERWWVYPPKLRACMSDIEKKLAEAGAGMVRESQRHRYSIYHDGRLFANEDDPTEANSIYDMLVRTYPRSAVELRENFVHPRIHQRILKQYPVSREISVVREATQITPSMRSYIRGAQAVRDVIHYYRDGRPPTRGVAYRARDGTYFVEAQDGQVYASMGWEEVKAQPQGIREHAPYAGGCARAARGYG